MDAGLEVGDARLAYGAGTTTAWMSFTGEQVNTYGAEPSRLFFMDATMFGLPVDVLHTYVGPSATMRVKACSLVPMAVSYTHLTLPTNREV